MRCIENIVSVIFCFDERFISYVFENFNFLAPVQTSILILSLLSLGVSDPENNRKKNHQDDLK